MSKGGRFGKYGETKQRERLKLKDKLLEHPMSGKMRITFTENRRMNPAHPGYRMRGHHK
jgi:hypothetical protein